MAKISSPLSSTLRTGRYGSSRPTNPCPNCAPTMKETEFCHPAAGASSAVSSDQCDPNHAARLLGNRVTSPPMYQ